jgi:hypothetical protein
MLTGKPNLIRDDKLSASASGGKSSYVTFFRTLPRLTVGVKKVYSSLDAIDAVCSGFKLDTSCGACKYVWSVR